MKKLILISLALSIAACSKDGLEDFESGYPCDSTLVETPDDSRPDILVIGDSISIGYTPFLQDALPSYDVSHNYCNGMSSKSGARHIDTWLSQRPTWDVVTINHAMWDIAPWLMVSDAEYEANLRYIISRIKIKTNNIFYVLGTKVPDNSNDGRINSNMIRKNAIAERVMNELGVTIIDLYSASESLDAYRVSPNDVHFTDAGSSFLADEILILLSSVL